MPECTKCGVLHKSTDRICCICGTLTGVAMPSNNELIGFGSLAFLAALAISVGNFLFMNWMTP